MLLGHCFINFHNEGAQFFEGKREVIDVNNGSVTGKDSIANNCSKLEISGVGCDSSGDAVLPLKEQCFLSYFSFFWVYTQRVWLVERVFCCICCKNLLVCLHVWKHINWSRGIQIWFFLFGVLNQLFFSADC